MPQNRLKELRDRSRLTQDEVSMITGRDRSRLTQDEVSMITGFSVATISRHESGSRGLSQDAIDRYSRLYKVRSYELFVDPGVDEPFYGDESEALRDGDE